MAMFTVDAVSDHNFAVKKKPSVWKLQTTKGLITLVE